MVFYTYIFPAHFQVFEKFDTQVFVTSKNGNQTWWFQKCDNVKEFTVGTYVIFGEELCKPTSGFRQSTNKKQEVDMVTIVNHNKTGKDASDEMIIESRGNLFGRN